MPDKTVKDPTLVKIIDFVGDIGLPIRMGEVSGDTFLPGIEVSNGGLLIDESKLLYPGDILHEAGHLAVTPAAHRSLMNGTVEAAGHPDVVEVEAICWSYAACVYLGLDLRVVFHENGYHGRSEALLMNFELGVFLGLSGLEAYGVTLSKAASAENAAKPFPSMQKWLRD